MKKRTAALVAILVVILFVGCGDQNSGQSEKTEDDYLAGYEEAREPETFGAEVSFEITGYLRKEDISDSERYINPDGTFNLYLSFDGGTPYLVDGPVYDHEMLSMQEYILRVTDNAPEYSTGGSYIKHLYHFTPISSGETELLLLYTYVVDEIYEGVIYHITVDEDLTCHIDWDGSVRQGENMELTGSLPEKEW